MATNTRLKTFIRLDSNGRTILGSDVRRLRAPRQGRWMEISTEPCCDGAQLALTPSDVDGTGWTVAILCDATTLLSAVAPGVSTTIETLTSLLNEQVGYLGRFTTDGTDINLSLKDTIVQDLACDGTLSFTVTD
jgi:hypothetical protein